MLKNGSILILILLLPLLGWSQRMEEVRISLQLQDVSLQTALQRIEAASPFRFGAKAEDIEGEKGITINASHLSVYEILRQVLAGRNLDYRQAGTNILITRREAAISTGRKYVLHGTVRTTRTGETVIGATVSILNSSIATASNEYGFYSLALPEGAYTVLVTAIGLAAKQVPLALGANTELNLALEEEAKELEAVTVASSHA